MAWVFPSFEDQRARCEARGGYARSQSWFCDVTSSSGDSVVVHYSQWKRRAALERHYLDTPGSAWTRVPATGTTPAHLQLDQVTPDGRYKTTIAYPRALFTVALYAASSEERARGVREQVSLRAEDDLSLRGTTG